MEDPKPKTKEQLEAEEEVLNTQKYAGLNDVPLDTPDIKFEQSDLDYLKSSTTWQALGLEAGLIEVLLSKGFKKPSKVQNIVIKSSKNNNVAIQSQNGSGKTLSFLIPVITTVDVSLKGKNEYGTPMPQVVILGDTKALILQIQKILVSLTENYKPMAVDYLFGGKWDLEGDCQVLVSTVAQLKNCFIKKKIDPKNIKLLVVDEADSVFESDLGKNFFAGLITKLQKTNDFKIILTSATVTEDSRKIIAKIQEKSNIITTEMPKENLTLKNVYQYMVRFSDNTDRLKTLDLLMKSVNAQNILIFANRKRDLEDLEQHLTGLGHKVGYIYKSGFDKNSGANKADYVQSQINDFLAGKYRILLTTNLLSRGIDMRKVTLVINFALPIKFPKDGDMSTKAVDVETYLHRVGRTGRFGDQGIALNFVHQNEQEMIDGIQDFYQNEIKTIDPNQMGNLNKVLEEIGNINQEKRDYLEENI